MTAPIRLATSQERVPVRACGTCAHVRDDIWTPGALHCSMFSLGAQAARASHRMCDREAFFYQARQPGIFERAWLWVFGGKA